MTSVVVLTDIGSFYAPRLLRVALAGGPADVSHVLLRHAQTSRPGLRRVLEEAGPRYALDRVASLAALRFRDRLRSAPELPGIRDVAEELGAEVVDIDSANTPTSRDLLAAADLAICAFYGEILEPETLGAPRLGSINVHPSLLPDLAGSNPIFWALAEGREVTGLTVHVIDEGIDTGPLLGQVEVTVPPGASQHALYTSVVDAGADLLRDVVTDVVAGRAAGQPHHEGGRTYRSRPRREDYQRFRRQGHRFVRWADLR